MRGLSLVPVVVVAACANAPASPSVVGEEAGLAEEAGAAEDAGIARDANAPSADAPATDAASVETITPHFRAWLAVHGYGDVDFARDGDGGSFGGLAGDGERVDAIPIVFVHGNSDAAIGRDETFTGWDAMRAAFAAKGRTNATLYGTTWGPVWEWLAWQQHHSLDHLSRVRRFFEAVSAYTREAGGDGRIVVVAHSMGVTLARKAIEGGPGEDPTGGGAYDLGPPLSFVDTFVGIAGANLGLVSCRSSPAYPTCGKIDGFWPGEIASDGPSKLLAAINATPHDEAAHVFSIWSKTDDLIGHDARVFERPTCAIPGQDGEVRLDGLGHFALKDESAEAVWRLITAHAP